MNKFILAVITARGGSKGIPKKNIKLLGGYPLIAYSIAQAKKSSLISECIISTDSEEIAQVSRDYGGNVPFMRPPELSTDTAQHVPVLQHAIDFVERKNGKKIDYIILLQPTSPFRLTEDIDGVLSRLIDTGAHSAVTVIRMVDNHPLKAKRLVDGFVEPYFSEYPEPEGRPRQQFPEAYKRSGAAYCMTRSLIMDRGLLYGEKIAAHVVPGDRSIDIDNEKDWVVAEYMLGKLKAQGLTFI